jgi:hypothetical protein
MTAAKRRAAKAPGGSGRVKKRTAGKKIMKTWLRPSWWILYRELEVVGNELQFCGYLNASSKLIGWSLWIHYHFAKHIISCTYDKGVVIILESDASILFLFWPHSLCWHIQFGPSAFIKEHAGVKALVNEIKDPGTDLDLEYQWEKRCCQIFVGWTIIR